MIGQIDKMLYWLLSAVRGGPVSIQDVRTEQATMLDLATAISTVALTGVGTEDILYDQLDDSHPWVFNGMWVYLGNLAAGDTVRFRIYVDEDNTGTYGITSLDAVNTYTGVQVLKWIHFAGAGVQGEKHGYRIRAEQTVVATAGLQLKVVAYDSLR
jgi:hypothetical protein